MLSNIFKGLALLWFTLAMQKLVPEFFTLFLSFTANSLIGFAFLFALIGCLIEALENKEKV
jgi:hypothetical protein